MSYKVEGTVVTIGETQSFGNNGFCKREIVLDIQGDSKYENVASFEVVKDKCAELDNVKVGSKIEIEFDLRGREYNGRYFTNLHAWRWSSLEDQNIPVPAGVDEVPF